ncbi:hypothetical protein ABZU75_19675 [Streptosporangium sp. NPDC005286]|uniref:hypothetical protein n=1 Tax=Streptosporangium sp. NPDC005286 TaxID=3154463 RepID=UPI0033AECC4E
MATAIVLLGLCLLAVTLCYLVLCLLSPWGTCTRCQPGGKNRTCRACNGTGMRPRLGWQLFVHFRRLHRDGTR